MITGVEETEKDRSKTDVIQRSRDIDFLWTMG